ncbi:MAG: hypothetical protein H0W95_03390 [Nocardioidaceae bacterium]|nr:hypothetical protein [Nocardioidaceae bacterium]
MTARPERPRAVTAACLLLGVGAVLVLAWSVVLVAALDEPQVRAELDRALAEGGLPSSVDAETLRELVRWLLTALAVGAVPVAVFAVFAARGDRVSRVALTVLGGLGALLFALAGVVGLLVSAVAVAAVVMLWVPSARGWYAPVSAPGPTDSAPNRHTGIIRHGGDRMSSSTPPPSDDDARGEPPPQPPAYGQEHQTQWQQQPPAHAQQQPQYGQPGHEQQPGYGQQPSHGQYGYGQPSPYPSRRPGTVTAAAWITIVMSALTGGLWALIGIGLLAAGGSVSDSILEEPEGRQFLQELDISVDQFRDGVEVAGIVGLVFGLLMLLAIIPAVMVLRGSNAGRVLLTVCAAVSLLIGLFFTVTGAIFGLIWVVAAGAVIAMMFVGEAGSWFAGKKAGAV